MLNTHKQALVEASSGSLSLRFKFHGVLSEDTGYKTNIPTAQNYASSMLLKIM